MNVALTSSAAKNVTRRRVFLSAEWRQLLMLNYPVPRELVAPFVPAGVELDEFGGQTYVSLVGFRFLQTKLWGVSAPGYRNFPEVNLRLYVRRRVGDEIRRGVVFVKEVVGRRAIALTARWFYNEPYVVLPIRDEVQWPGANSEGPPRAKYAVKPRGEWFSLSAEGTGEAQPLAPGSLEEYIAEHYYGYGRLRNGRTVEYHVDHPPWRVWQTKSAAAEGDFAALYGEDFARVLRAKPESAFLSDGSAVTVAWPTFF